MSVRRDPESRDQARAASLGARGQDSHLVINFVFGPVSGMGGTERRMLDLVSELRSRGVLVRSIAPAPSDRRLNCEMAAAGAQVVLYGTPIELVSRAARWGADATWAFGARAAYPLAVGRRLPVWRGGKLLVAKNGLEAFRSRPSMLLERLLIRSADLVVANSEAAAELAATRSHARRERIRVLPSALPSEWMARIDRGQRSPVRVAMIGNVHPEKQHALGIRAFMHLDDPQTVLDVFTNEGQDLKNRLAAVPAHFRDRVSIHEGVDVTPDIMRSIDVLLHPSSSESLPRVALEARSQDAWVIGFDVGDLAQYCRARIRWGDEAGLVNSLRDACQAARLGMWPAPAEVMAVPEYADRLLGLIRELPDLSSKGAA